MNVASQIFALLAAFLHVFVFCLESLWFMRPNVHRRFGAQTQADAEARRLFAFNQGFYNLFLALGTGAGLAILNTGGDAAVGSTLVLFSCACMVFAGVVLVASAGMRMLRAGVLQALWPALAWACWLIFD